MQKNLTSILFNYSPYKKCWNAFHRNDMNNYWGTGQPCEYEVRTSKVGIDHLTKSVLAVPLAKVKKS